MVPTALCRSEAASKFRRALDAADCVAQGLLDTASGPCKVTRAARLVPRRLCGARSGLLRLPTARAIPPGGRCGRRTLDCWRRVFLTDGLNSHDLGAHQLRPDPT